MEPQAGLCLVHGNDVPDPPANTFGFYLVWNPGRALPKKRHATLESAQKEAERLAKKQPNESFYVLQTVTVDRSYFDNIVIRAKTHFNHEEQPNAIGRYRCN